MRLNRRTFACIALTALLAAAPARADIGPPDLTEEELGLIRAVNVMRKARGLDLLVLRRDLSQAARAYAKRMADEDFFSHVAPDGNGRIDRAEAAGYDWRRLGEMLAAGYRTPEATARS